MFRRVRLGFLLFVFDFSLFAVRAQQTLGAINGTAADSTGVVLPEVQRESQKHRDEPGSRCDHQRRRLRATAAS